MAQFFENFEGYAIGTEDIPDYLIPLNSGVAEIDNDSGAATDRVLRYARSGSVTYALLIDALPATNGDSEIICRLRYGDTSSNCLIRPRHVDLNNEVGRLYEARSTGSKGLDVRQRAPSLSTIASGSNNKINNVTVFHYLHVFYDSTNNRVKILTWDGTLDDKPDPAVDGYYLEATGTVDASLTAKQSFATFGGFVRIDWFGIGTDGDPAPTGPVSGITIPSPVIDTVTANSIKWTW